ncbi:MAG TPA: MFS transporter [Mycobacteriales bacterium]|nr:MFS transporter [Mycobacteriales bacterium]
MSLVPSSYGPLLRTPTVARALGTSLLARVGQPAGALAVTLLVIQRTGSYAAVGVVAATWVIGVGVGSLFWSRLVDGGRSARAVLVGTAAGNAAGLVALVTVRTGSALALTGLTLAAALFTPPAVPVVRALWPVVLTEPDARASMYSLEATVQELIFIVGPSLAGAAAAVASPSAAVLLAGVLAVVGAVSFAATPGLERIGSSERPPVRPGALVPLVPLFAAGFLLLCGLSWVEVGVVGAAGTAGDTAATGALFAVWSAGSLVGGLLGGARPARRGPGRRLLLLLAAVAGGHALLAVYPGLVALGALLVLAGGLVAPALAGIYTLVGEVAPAGAVAQTFAGLAVAFLGGSATGSALAGLVVQAHGPGTAFLLGAVPPALAAVLVGLTIARSVAVPRPAG